MHVAVRGLRHGDLPESSAAKLAEDVERVLAALPGVEWAVANTVLGHAVVGTEGPFETETITDALIEAVEAVEEAHGVTHPLPEHPVSGGTVRRAASAMALHMAAAPMAALAGLTRRTPIPAGLAALAPLVDTHPRLRRLVEQTVGTENAGVLLALLTAVGQAGSGGLVGVGVDALRHALRAMEADAEAAAWAAAEPRLAGSAAAGAHRTPPAGPARETRLTPGPVEHYADQALAVAAASFTGSLLVTRSTKRAAGAALAAIPKAPLLAREGFACAFGRELARRGVVVADPDALRRLDRVGTVLLDTDALTTGAQLPARLIPLDEDTPLGELSAMAYRLFDGSAPDRLQRDGEWVLGPVEHLTLRGRTGKRARERLRREGARLVLGLAQGPRLLAVISVLPEMRDAASGFVPAARTAGLRIMTAGEHTSDQSVREADAVSGEGDRLVDTVRALQRDGDGVLLVSHDRSALLAADVGVGITDPRGTPPWGADLYLDGDLAPAVVIVEACRTARETAHRGVRLAQAAAAVGAT
ncbi:hypothetical protein AB0D38_00195, partial [Streptomyces sp. NPDC048279]